MKYFHCALALALCGTATGASAQTIALGIEDGSDLVRGFDITMGVSFYVVTTIDTDGTDAQAAEWFQTDLQALVPQVFRLSSTSLFEVDLCTNCGLEPGVYVGPFRDCESGAAPMQALRIQYGDFGGVVGDDVVLSVRGLMPGDPAPSTFDGSPGFIDCDHNRVPLAPAGDALQTGSGAIVPPGGVILNPSPPLVVGAEDIPVSHLKARFR